MKCPDLDRLIDFDLGNPDAELEDHLKNCKDCQEDMGLLYLLPTAAGIPEEVPDRLVRSVLETLRGATEEGSPSHASLGQKVVTGAIGFLTAVGGLVLTGSPADGGPILLLVLSVSVGAVCALLGDSVGREKGRDPVERPS
jgi:hypothetical protein